MEDYNQLMFNRLWSLILIASFLFLPQAISARTLYKERIAIISAFGLELDLLKSETEIERIEIINGVTFTIGKLRGNDVVLFLSGISIPNAVMKTQLLLDNFEVERVIFSGVAGGVNPSLSVLDVTVPEQWALYQEMYFAKQVNEQFPILDEGGVPLPTYLGLTLADVHKDEGGNYGAVNNYAFVYTRKTDVVSMQHHDSENFGAGEQVFWMPVDAEMLEVATNALASVAPQLSKCAIDPETGTVLSVCLDRQPEIVFKGNGVSGSTFVDNKGYREYVFNIFRANVLDMETAGTAFVCRSNNVPYLAFRTLSDLAGGDEENLFGTFFLTAANNSAKVVLEFLDAWRQYDTRKRH
jgi:adenosylhomocysteine nucleosidase